MTPAEGALPVAPVEAQEAPCGREDRDWRAYGQEMHRRAQVAEGALAAKPEYATLTDALNELRRVKSERHVLRNEVSFMKNERARLKREIADLRAANAALTQSGVDEPRPGADTEAEIRAKAQAVVDASDGTFTYHRPLAAALADLASVLNAATGARHSPRGGGTT